MLTNDQMEKMLCMQLQLNDAFVNTNKSMEVRLRRLENIVENLADDVFERFERDESPTGLLGLNKDTL